MANEKVQEYSEYSDEKLRFVKKAILEAIVMASNKGHNIDELIRVLTPVTDEIERRNGR